MGAIVRALLVVYVVVPLCGVALVALVAVGSGATEAERLAALRAAQPVGPDTAALFRTTTARAAELSRPGGRKVERRSARLGRPAVSACMALGVGGYGRMAGPPLVVCKWWR